MGKRKRTGKGLSSAIDRHVQFIRRGGNIVFENGDQDTPLYDMVKKIIALPKKGGGLSRKRKKRSGGDIVWGPLGPPNTTNNRKTDFFSLVKDKPIPSYANSAKSILDQIRNPNKGPLSRKYGGCLKYLDIVT